MNIGLIENPGDIPIEEQPGIEEIPKEPQKPQTPQKPGSSQKPEENKETKEYFRHLSFFAVFLFKCRGLCNREKNGKSGIFPNGWIPCYK